MRRDAALFQHPNPVRLAIGDVNRAGGAYEDAVRAGETALAGLTIRPIAPLPCANYSRDDAGLQESFRPNCRASLPAPGSRLAQAWSAGRLRSLS